MTGRTVIVGASLGGVQTALALRSSGFHGEIVLAGAEEHLPYDRPALSKQYLCEPQTSAADLSLLDAATARELGIEMQLGVAAVELDHLRRAVVFADGREIGFDTCVVATGARPRLGPWPATRNMLALRTIDDAAALRAALRPGIRVAVIGAGFVGAEVASSARSLGCDVTVIDPAPVPLLRAAGPQVATALAGLPARSGVQVRLGVGVESIQDDASTTRLALSDGATLDVDVVVVGIGATPNDQWLTSSGLTAEDGLHCDQRCRALGTLDVFAVGDVARWQHGDYNESTRLEHWTNATQQAQIVAHNIAQPETPLDYRPVEYVWSDQYGVKLQLTGRFSAVESVEVIGDLDFGAARPQAALVCADTDHKLVACATVNWPRASVQARRLLAEGMQYGAALDALRALAPTPTAVAQ